MEKKVMTLRLRLPIVLTVEPPMWSSKRFVSALSTVGLFITLFLPADAFASAADDVAARLDAGPRRSLEQLRQIVPEIKSMPLQKDDVEDQLGLITIHGAAEASDLYITFSLDQWTGKIHFYQRAYSKEPNKQGKSQPMSRREIREKCVAYATSLLGGDWAQYRGDGPLMFRQVDDAASYTLNLPRDLNGGGMIDDGCVVSVDEQGTLISFFRPKETPRDPGDYYPSTVNWIAKDQAVARLRRESPMRLMYVERLPVTVDEQGNTISSRPALIYAPTRIDPIDGETGLFTYDPFLDRWGVFPKWFATPMHVGYWTTIMPPAETLVQVKGGGAPSVVANLDESAAWISQYMGVDMTGKSLDKDRSRWFMYASVEERREERYSSWSVENIINIRISKDTGRITYFSYKENGYQRQEPEADIGPEAAQATAIAFIQQFLPPGDHAMLIKAHPVANQMPEPDDIPEWVNRRDMTGWIQSDPPSYVFQFIRLYQGIPVKEQYFQVSLDGRDGRITRFEMPKSMSIDTALPDSDQAIAPEKAMDVLLADVPFSRTYYYPVYRNIFTKYTYRPVYRLSSVGMDTFWEGPLYVDAFTGNLVSFPKVLKDGK
ncbi:hypothetical protein GTO91_09930 [Heliobacterium undosum]|uniref:YcdB/YcdC repeated domain-containing protein n=1 Tax=Heliomicrobium undosum TaxID=121734 RepID=A0A845L1D1_9FIRM|nr:YcdB/YcdC domain-containing protein [Heliomicrobium undosum]MZP30023.1 hypothetical protein [Heliomicrobium undosum]